jgi:hypothetical protein
MPSTPREIGLNLMKNACLMSAVGLLAALCLASNGWGEGADVNGSVIRRVWLSHRGTTPDRMVVNWTSGEPGESLVRYRPEGGDEHQVRVPGERTLHHVEVPLAEPDTAYTYSVHTGDAASEEFRFRSYPSDVLRVAVVADWHGRPDLAALIEDRPHLLLTAGDNIGSIWQRCGQGRKGCVTPYAELIDAYPGLFRSTPFLPVLGNHDREIRPRGDKPPEEPVYDVDATAFRRFFELPGDEWKWHFDLPAFGLRLVALDLNHISDFGTTWQTCHEFGEDSEQFRWYEELTDGNVPPLVVMLYNERNASVRSQAGGKWHGLFRRGTLCVTGFGHFAERAEVDGVAYFNTSLSGKGNQYPDPRSKFLAGEDNYLLLTCDRRAGTLTAEIKSLDGAVLDRTVHHRRD